MTSVSPTRRGGRASAQARTDESEIILALVASGLMRLASWTGPQDSRQPYPSALQQGLDRLTWWCMQRGLEPPASVAALVARWCPRPLAEWGMELSDGAVGDGDRLIIDGELTETCRDWAVASPDVVGDLLESRFMLEVRSTCRGMGARGQEIYVALRGLMVEAPLLTGPALLQHKNRFPDLAVWARWLADAYVPVNAADAPTGEVASCSRCRQVMRPSASAWVCATPRCRALSRPPRSRVQPAKGAVRLRAELVAYVSLPGRAEADLAAALENLGARVEWWPDIDSYDLLVIWPDGQRWAIDVKDWKTAYLLARHLKPLPVYPQGHEYAYDAAYIVIPADRSRRQRNYLRVLRSNSFALGGESGLRALTDKDLLAMAMEVRHGA
jgi:REase associating with pPIWI_RE/pPIWI_RE three-gene island domain Y